MATPFLARFHAKKKTRVAQMHRTISGQENITYSSPNGLTPGSLLFPPLPPQRMYGRTLTSQPKFLGWKVHEILHFTLDKHSLRMSVLNHEANPQNTCMKIHCSLEVRFRCLKYHFYLYTAIGTDCPAITKGFCCSDSF